MKVTTDACLFGGWVAQNLQESEEEPQSILDIGTGTGLLALMIAQATRKSQVYALEINQQAYSEARENFLAAPWCDRLHLSHSSLQDHQSTIEFYDVIICNPPFFKASLKGIDTHKNQALHELTLDQADLLAYAPKLLSPQGSLYLLYPEREMNLMIIQASKHHLYPYRQVLVRNTSDGASFRKMVEFKLNGSSSSVLSEIVIKDNQGKYTPEFWDLLKSYYLLSNDPNSSG